MKEERNPYHVVKSRYVTEKTTVLGQLASNESNKCVAKCESPKYVFIVDKKAGKNEIRRAIETIYADRKIKVKAVNTLIMKPKRRRVRGKEGFRSAKKKAIITLEKGDSIDDGV